MKARYLRLMALAAICFAALTTQALAKVAIVYRNDRNTPMRGELVAEGPDKIVIKIANIDTPIPRHLIDRIEYELTVPEEYAEKTRDLAKTDIEGRYKAIKWLYGLSTDQADRLAVRELRGLLADQKDHQQARLLMELIQQRIKDRNKPDDGGGNGSKPDKPDSGNGQTEHATRPGKARTLTKEERNLMKVIEVVLDDKPRIAISDRDMIDFYDKYREDPALADYRGRRGRTAFLNLDGYQKMDIIFRTKASDYYKKVSINDEPQPLQTFRQKIAGGLVGRHCGSCHGGGKAPGLHIITERATGEEVAYTNLLILSRAKSRNLPLIDRNVPNESLLLQYGLPREEARYPHPDVRGFKHFFSGVDDPRFAEAVSWVNSLYRKANYPIEYKLPKPAEEEKDAEAEE